MRFALGQLLLEGSIGHPTQFMRLPRGLWLSHAKAEALVLPGSDKGRSTQNEQQFVFNHFQ